MDDFIHYRGEKGGDPLRFWSGGFGGLGSEIVIADWRTTVSYQWRVKNGKVYGDLCGRR